jgi:hypothetical protein
MFINSVLKYIKIRFPFEWTSFLLQYSYYNPCM